MNPERLDIVQLIENNPIAKLSCEYQTRLLDKIKDTFNDNDQQLFIASFYCYLNYNPKTDYIINMDDVWKWLGFSRKDHCKRVIEKHFMKDIDYKIALPNSGERKNEGGFNKETILMNIETFKSLCLLASTERSKTVRKYYYKLEQTLHELLEEQASELKKQLEQKNREVENTVKQLEEKNRELETYKQKTYEEVEKTGHIYIIKTDAQGAYKVGKTRDTVSKRIKGMQTANVNNIEMILDYKTSNPDLLERCVHYILDRYRCNSNREFFDCNIEYIKMIVNTCGHMIDTLKSSYQDITVDELYSKLNIECITNNNTTSSVSYCAINTTNAYDEFINTHLVKNSHGTIKWIELYRIYCEWYKNKYNIETINKKQVKLYFETYVFCAKEYPIRNVGRGWYGWSLM